MNSSLIQLAPLNNKETEYWGIISFEMVELHKFTLIIHNFGIPGYPILEIKSEGHFWKDPLVSKDFMKKFELKHQ